MKFIALVLSSLLLISIIPSKEVKLPINWDKLSELVQSDTVLTSSEKIGYNMIQDIPDTNNYRYNVLKKAPYFNYLEENILPKLETESKDESNTRQSMD